jgi:hypothetical protein
MRSIVEYKERPNDVPLLRIYAHDAPHRRQHYQVIQKFREELVRAAQAANIKIPITHPVELYVLFVNPSSPDIDNAIVALYRALDGTSLKGPAILEDDGLIIGHSAFKFFPYR